jgi:hypothetical protein
MAMIMQARLLERGSMPPRASRGNGKTTQRRAGEGRGESSRSFAFAEAELQCAFRASVLDAVATSRTFACAKR